jgi:hypothetical protein
MSYSISQIELKAHIEAENALHANSHLSVTSNLAHWIDRDINTTEQYNHYMASEAHADIFREINGIKPTFINYDKMSTKEIHASIDLMVDNDNQFIRQQKIEAQMRKIESQRISKQRKLNNAYKPNLPFFNLKGMVATQIEQ